MKNSCKTCAVPVEERPEPCIKSGCIDINTSFSKGKTRFFLEINWHGWKPIEVCRTCEGLGRICKDCGKAKSKCNWEYKERCWVTVPCPDCQSEKAT
jgi:hypothetical protein